MLPFDLITFFAVLSLGAVLAYKISYLHNKNIGYFSLLQILYLVVIPGFGFVMIFSYMQAILARPLNEVVYIPDSLLVNLLLLSILFTYGGIAIHAVTKMLASLEDVRSKVESEVHEMNKFFHLKFSHNLMFGGILLVVICFTLLELNHAAVGIQKEILPAVFKGLILGGSIITTMYWYTTSKDEYSGRWSDLKTFFLVFWLGFIVVLYLIKQYDPNIQDYQLLLPALIGFSSVALLNIILVIRKTSRGGFKLYFILGTFKRKLFEVEK